MLLEIFALPFGKKSVIVRICKDLLLDVKLLEGFLKFKTNDDEWKKNIEQQHVGFARWPGSICSKNNLLLLVATFKMMFCLLYNFFKML